MPDAATRLPNDDASGGVDYYVTEEECSSVNEDERSREKRSENDVTENEIELRPANSRDAASSPNKSTSGTENENNVTKELDDAEIVPNRGPDITVPGISENEEIDENTSPRGENYNLRPNPPPTILKNTDISQKDKLKVPLCFIGLKRHILFPGTVLTITFDFS